MVLAWQNKARFPLPFRDCWSDSKKEPPPDIEKIILRKQWKEFNNIKYYYKISPQKQTSFCLLPSACLVWFEQNIFIMMWKFYQFLCQWRSCNNFLNKLNDAFECKSWLDTLRLEIILNLNCARPIRESPCLHRHRHRHGHRHRARRVSYCESTIEWFLPICRASVGKFDLYTCSGCGRLVSYCITCIYIHYIHYTILHALHMYYMQLHTLHALHTITSITYITHYYTSLHALHVAAIQLQLHSLLLQLYTIFPGSYMQLHDLH